ncbi:hypothetical protein F5B20DRAFT_588643 [Whalleya microplaca]|nr:hypothetical protein F5B20DRAFT_588643 [Whalleya microplaca]
MFRAQLRRTVLRSHTPSIDISKRTFTTDPGFPPVKALRPTLWCLGVSGTIYLGCATYEVYQDVQSAKSRGFKADSKGYAGSYEALEDLSSNPNFRWATSPPRNYGLGLPGVLSEYTEAEKVMLGAAALNIGLYAACHISPSLSEHFSHTPAFGKNYTLLTSMFGHTGLLHLGLNMFGLLQFTPGVARSSTFEGSGSHLTAFLLSSGIITNLGQHMASIWPRPMERFAPSLGFSGALMAVLGAWAMTYPNAQVGIVLIPGSWPANQLVAAAALVELVGIFKDLPFLRWAHAAHFTGVVKFRDDNMGAPFPSIQSFYSREIPSSSSGTLVASSPAETGDGFTPSEVEEALDPLSRPWKPSRFYETCPIALLETGPRNYQITGRIVNFSTNQRQQKVQTSLEGHYFLVVADGSAAIAIKLYYAKISDYNLILGQRLTIWASYIADSTKAEIGYIPFCAVAATIYPGRNGATHIAFHSDAAGSEDYRSLRCPLECNLKKYDYLPDLMTLKAFLSTGYDMGEGKILVCIRSIGLRRTIRLKKRPGTVDMVEVGVFDDTASCVLKLWEDKVASAKTWVPNQTVLLISKPTCRVNENSKAEHGVSAEIGIGYSSMVDVDPDFPDANWPRNKVKTMTKKDRIYVPFPAETWNIEFAIHGPNRTLFTIAEVEEQVRHPDLTIDFTGKLNVVILEMNLMEHWRKGTTCCFECCGIPLYANKPIATCKNCGLQRELALNPRIIGSMIDESGMITASKLVWRDDAWSQLFFGITADETHVGDGEVYLSEQSWEDLTVLDTISLRDIEEYLLYSRITLTFGWSSMLERICILGVEW